MARFQRADRFTMLLPRTWAAVVPPLSRMPRPSSGSPRLSSSLPCTISVPVLPVHTMPVDRPLQAVADRVATIRLASIWERAQKKQPMP